MLCLLREYFANREAAQLIKARAEAQLRGGVGGGINGSARPSRSADDDGGGGARVALVKAQREREKEKELAAKEREVRGPYYLFHRLCIYVVHGNS